MTVNIGIKLLHPDARTPTRATEGSAGWDLYAVDYVDFALGEIQPVKTGIAVALPSGYEAQIRPRSSTELRGLRVTFGTIDADYRGEISVIIHCECPDWHGGTSIRKGERIAQLVIAPVPAVQFIQVDQLDETTRGAGGFGSTGR
jgi:dUTP pyrophosphatase